MALGNALDTTKILTGGALVKIGGWTYNAAAATLLSFGHLLTPAELGFAFEDFDIETEQSIGRVKTIPVSANYTLKFDVAQNEADAMLIASRQPSTQLTGSNNTTVLGFSDPKEIYYQVALIGSGYATSGTETYTFWKAQVSSVDNIPFGKKAVQHLGMTLKILRDDSISAPLTNGYYGNRKFV